MYTVFTQEKFKIQKICLMLTLIFYKEGQHDCQFWEWGAPANSQIEFIYLTGWVDFVSCTPFTVHLLLFFLISVEDLDLFQWDRRYLPTHLRSHRNKVCLWPAQNFCV